LMSAIITDVLVNVVMQNVIVRHEILRNKRFIEKVGHLFFKAPSLTNSSRLLKQDLINHLLFSQDRIQTLLIVDAQRNVLYRRNSQDYDIELLEKPVEAAKANIKTEVHKLGYVWSLFWWYPKAVSISVPVLNNTQLDGVVAAVVPMTSIYETLRKYHKPIFFYIIINTCVLTIIGLYRIFRLYLRPIDRIILQADDFHEEEDLFFAFRHEDNELNRLSSALNRMLTRISSDKKKLRDTVRSLELSNMELKNAQKEIIRSEKMASVGRLAAGIAHEIGNPIGIVLGYLEMLKGSGIGDEDKADFLRRTEEEVQRINTVIRQLLDLARPKDTQNKLVSVQSVIEDIVDVMQLQPMMSGTIIELDLKASSDLVWGNTEQLRQVFLNLLLNAADAIQSAESNRQGKIHVRTTVLDREEMSKGTILQVHFQDNGDGIDLDKLQNIFDPFYTTKESGKGTGLGLAVSFMIIEGMGGTIRARSQPGQGATFSIELPMGVNDIDTENGDDTP
ncbi:MAG: ATP-binding protein, partial [Desulfobacteraceae bacterium]